MKKFLIAILASTMVLSLAACGGGTETTPEDVNPGSQQEHVDEPVTDTEEQEDSGENTDDTTVTGSLWNDPTYSTYTTGLAEPTVKYEIRGVLMDQLTLNLEVTEAELADYKQSLLDVGFELYRDGEGSWGMSNDTHNIQMNGHYDGIAYVYIGLQQ